MRSFPLGRIVLTWVLFVPLAFLNAVIRDKVYRSKVGELRAHQISTALASAAFFMLKKQVIHLDRMRLLLVGASWVSLTMLFEFGFMHFVAKIPWKKLFADYNLLQGRVWPLFLLTELASPLLVKFMKNLR